MSIKLKMVLNNLKRKPSPPKRIPIGPDQTDLVVIFLAETGPNQNNYSLN